MDAFLLPGADFSLIQNQMAPTASSWTSNLCPEVPLYADHFPS